MEFNELKILSGKYWGVFLHQDQTAIGRLYFWYNQEANDLLDVPEKALTEFHKLGNKIKSTLNKQFNPDMFNYLSLNNATEHLHIHIIPRYSKKIELFGLIFEDTSFGKSYKSNPKFIVNKDILIKIRDKIKYNVK